MTSFSRSLQTILRINLDGTTPGERSVDKGGRLWNLGRLILQNEEELALCSQKRRKRCWKSCGTISQS